MSDPRAEDRQKQEDRRPDWMPTQVAERLRLGLSPVDDSLPFAQAVRQKEDTQHATDEYRASKWPVAMKAKGRRRRVRRR